MPHPDHRGRYSTRYGMYKSQSTRPVHSGFTESRSSSSDYISQPTYSSSDYISAQVDPSAYAYEYDVSEDYIAQPYESRADYISPRSRSRSRSRARQPQVQMRKKKAPSGSRRKTKTTTELERRDSGIAGSRTRPALTSSGTGSSFSSPIEGRREARRRDHSNSPSSVGSRHEDSRRKPNYGFVADAAWEERREVVRSQGFTTHNYDERNESRVKHRTISPHHTYTSRKEPRSHTLPGAFVDEESDNDNEPEEPTHHHQPTTWAPDSEKAASDVSTFRSGSASGLASPLLSPSFSAPYSLTSSKRRGSDYCSMYDSSCERSNASDVVRNESSEDDDSASDEDDISNGSDYVFDGEDRSDVESIAAGSDVASVSDVESEPEVRERERGYQEAYVEDDYEGYSDEEA